MSNGSNSDGYFNILAKSAPLFAAKAILADTPRGALEYAVEKKVTTPNKKFLALLRDGSKGRGTGRALGGTAAVLAAPLYLKSISLLSSKDPNDKKRGLAYAIGGSSANAVLKGGLEGAYEARVGKKPLADAIRSGLSRGVSRMGVGALPAVLTASSIAAGRKKSKNDGSKYLAPMAVGAATGGLKKGLERSGELKLRKLPQSRRALLGALAGGAAAGAFGGGILAKVTDMALKPPKAPKKDVVKSASSVETCYARELRLAHEKINSGGLL